VVESLRKVTKLPLEAHLMISDPDQYIDAFVKAGIDGIMVHYEGAIHLHRTLHHIRGQGKKVGVVINPATSPVVVEEFLSDVDLVLVMTVNPGFGGQEFIHSTLPKIRRLRQMIDKVKPDIELEVDGGIEPHTSPLVVEAGARVLVAGSAIFHAREGIKAGMQNLVAGIKN